MGGRENSNSLFKKGGLEKVGTKEWCLFFDFVCFSGCHFTQPGFAKKDIVESDFFL